MTKSNPEIALDPVAPCRPVAPWLGGKRNLAKRLVAKINAIPHETYAEAFIGMGGVFFRRDRRPKCEVINDANEDVATLFRVLQHHYVAFIEMIRFQISSRANFEKLCRQDPTTLTDLQRAARFLYLQRLAFGGKVAGSRSFGVAPGLGARFDVTKLVPMLEDMAERLSGVVIERLDWQAFLKRWDRPRTLFYLDPPYFGNEADYGADLFDRSQFEAMADCLAQLKGRFVLSINDQPQVRQIFAGFAMEEVGTTYTIGTKAKRVGELVISSG
ncbi:DNA adenine methylase [Altericroceibacterium endophyticum]|uniref:site-specific DNA-methyltransferase (adenine-specific) n=1 Tax=Altericroceibacterium endophyticum TaxID=1808508 RepID=A0A6I4T3I4_9SPHN|nr:DNA adenine methylase [Altericroceibacterium endophyticum]MXO64832.1 DNA adenine methylase [Altericroceibacterium endophyticum]